MTERLTGEDLTLLREGCFTRDGGRCVRCDKKLHFHARFDGDPDAYDMAHKRNKRMYGDSLENVEAWCHACHMGYHQGGKPCRSKR